MKLDCSNGANSNQAINSRKQLIKYINKKEFENTKRFGFPLTNREKFIINPYTTPDSFTRMVYDNIIDMDNKNITINPNEYPEVILNFEETGVEYIVFSGYNRGGICPRYNADGTLRVREE